MVVPTEREMEIANFYEEWSYDWVFVLATYEDHYMLDDGFVHWFYARSLADYRMELAEVVKAEQLKHDYDMACVNTHQTKFLLCCEEMVIKTLLNYGEPK